MRCETSILAFGAVFWYILLMFPFSGWTCAKHYSRVWGPWYKLPSRSRAEQVSHSLLWCVVYTVNLSRTGVVCVISILLWCLFHLLCVSLCRVSPPLTAPTVTLSRDVVSRGAPLRYQRNGTIVTDPRALNVSSATARPPAMAGQVSRRGMVSVFKVFDKVSPSRICCILKSSLETIFWNNAGLSDLSWKPGTSRWPILQCKF